MVNPLPVKKGLSAPAVTSIPDKWDRQWFRNFITQFLVNADIRNVQGVNVQGNVSGNSTTATNSTAVTIGVFTPTSPGLVPASGTPSGKFLQDNGTFQTAGGGSVPTPPGGSNTQVQFNNGGAFGGSATFTWNGTTLTATNITSSGTIQGGTLNATSDPTLKMEITRIANPAYILSKINGYKFKWIDSQKPSLGVMSNEVKEVAPELIATAPNGKEAVNYNGLIAILIEEVKRLRLEVDILTGRLS